MASKRPLNPDEGLSTPSNKWVKMSGTSRLPNPKHNAAAMMNRSRRVNLAYANTLAPDVATLAKRNVVTPPRTELGTLLWPWLASERGRGKLNVLARKTPEIFPRIPKRMRKKQHHLPAARLAHLVMAITPLFYLLSQTAPGQNIARGHTWANTDSGVTVKSAERKPPKPSA